jgi:pimeloyl-ACP methyl ester carboxylesterase
MRRILGIALVVLGAGTVTAVGQEASKPGELRLLPCQRSDIGPPAKCGTFTVWENRGEKSGRTIDLNVVVLEATGPDPLPDPYVFLLGGPGQAATSIARALNDAAERERRDILLVDQRGTGESNGLLCGPERAAPLQAFMATMDARRVQACRNELEKRADLRYYLTPYAMDDLDDLRVALGYERINLDGGSYGTRAALVYIRRHGQHVRTARLDGALAFGYRIPIGFAADAEASLRNVLADCAAEPECAAAFPTLADDYRRAFHALESEGPLALRVRDPRTGDSVDVTFSAADFAESLRAMLYAPEPTRRIPAILHHAATTGDYRPFVDFQLNRNLGLTEGIAEGMYFAITCTEDVARLDAAAIEASGRGTFLAQHRTRPHVQGCEGWPPGRLPPGYHEEVASDVPVLIMTGSNDPATPPASAHAAASRLSNARVIIVPGGGHGFGGLAGAECLQAIGARFLETADPRTLDTSCVANVHRKPFVLSVEPAR